MKKYLIRIPLAFKATRELGPSQTFRYALYQLGLRSGAYQRATPTGTYEDLPLPIKPPFTIPGREWLTAVLKQQAAQVIDEAEEIAAGQVRLFGGPPVPLQLVPKDTSQHWTYYESRPASWGVEDLKFIWEPARFGWVYPLGRAFALTGNERYPQIFWENLETFLQANPPNRGPNWSSAQEVALRLLAWLFAACVFQTSLYSTPARMARLVGALAAHAGRIPATLDYARAQNNNHLISEALGLYAAGCALPAHPQAKTWRSTGWRTLNQALQNQIRPDGTYSQHSLNYHRLMLHGALQGLIFGQAYPPKTLRRLAAATTWLLAQLDPASGRTPNLGSNDGANILPLASADFGDYRPVAQAAARAFLGRPALPPGPWDELCLWLGQPLTAANPLPPLPESSAVQRLGGPDNWATLRAVHFYSRPSHADQLHVELWWLGENLAMDAGTYRYTAPPPWDNALAQTSVHNTLEIECQNQMLRSGRFLWLDWAQAKRLNTRNFEANAIGAQHNGYRHLGIIHRRILKQDGPDRWQVIDHVQSTRTASIRTVQLRIHWLLPDWPWALEDHTLTLTPPSGGQVQLTLLPDELAAPPRSPATLSLIRAGKALVGPEKVAPILGWYSPGYQLKVPALSFSLTVQASLPYTIHSDWVLSPH